MKNTEEYEQLSKKAAHLIVRAIKLFKDEPQHIQKQAQQIIMQRVQRMMNGEPGTIEGEGLVREIVDPSQPDPINTSSG